MDWPRALSPARWRWPRAPTSPAASRRRWPDAGARPDGGDADATTADGAAPLSFATAVYPLLVPACEGCHSAGNEAGDTQLLFVGAPAADHATVVMFVNTSAPASSRLLAKTTGNGHQGGAVYAAGSAEYNTILQWIQQGAQP